MAAGTRSIKIKIDGSVDGLRRAAKAAQNAVDGMNKGILGKVQNLAGKIPDILSGVIDSIPPMGKPIAFLLVGGLAAALAPLLAAAISSALLLAVGGGVLAAGIAAVAKTPKVKAAFGKLKDSMFDKDTSDIEKKIQAAQERFMKAQALGQAAGMRSAKYDIKKAKKELEDALAFNKANKSFKDMFTPFIDPLVRAAGTFKKTFDELKPTFERMAKTVAPIIDKLAPALGDFLKRMMPGIEKAVAASVPLFETLADKLPGIGDAISMFFSSISENSDDANEFFGDLLDAITYIIIGLGKAIGKLTSWYSNIKDFVKKAIAEIGKLYQGIKDFLEKAKKAFEEFRQATIGQIERIRAGAEKALGWIPGIGGKLRGAQGEFNSFQAGANKALRKIKDRNVKVTVSSNIGSVAAQYANLIAGMVNKGASVGKRASGGAVIAGRSYVVGEKKAEIFTPATNGRISPSTEGAAGQVINLALDLGEGISQAFQIKIDRNNRATVNRLRAKGARA